MARRQPRGIDAVRAYETKYGALAEFPISEWDAGFPEVKIDRVEFEEVWARARAHLEAKYPESASPSSQRG